MTKKVLTLLSLAILATACNMNSPEMITKQISKKKDQVKKLNGEIALLEENIQQDSVADIKFSVPVSIKSMTPEPFKHFIEITGKLEAEEDAFISPELNGQIETVHVKEGDYVKKGSLLVSLNTNLIESSIREVKTGLELAKKIYDKQKGLWDQQIGSELQYLEARNAKEQAEARLATLEAQMDMARVRAPFSGVVETILMKEGELAIPGMQLVQMVSLDKLKLYGNISERYMSNINKGDILLVDFPDVEGLAVEAPIFRVGNMIDNASRTFRIEVKIDNKKGLLKPNMHSILQVNDFSSSAAFVVPSVVIKQDIKGNYIYIADTKELKARKRYVKTGLSYKDQTLIPEGISEDDKVIIKGFAQVSDGVNIDLR
ncbi:efflux RND transporter periplasmic adaptor subunit [Bacteroidota bacterium]